jgi:hypothetical protein
MVNQKQETNKCRNQVHNKQTNIGKSVSKFSNRTIQNKIESQVQAELSEWEKPSIFPT